MHACRWYHLDCIVRNISQTSISYTRINRYSANCMPNYHRSRMHGTTGKQSEEWKECSKFNIRISAEWIWFLSQTIWKFLLDIKTTCPIWIVLIHIPCIHSFSLPSPPTTGKPPCASFCISMIRCHDIFVYCAAIIHNTTLIEDTMEIKPVVLRGIVVKRTFYYIIPVEVLSDPQRGV